MTDDETKLREIVARGKQVRKPLPRWLWTAALAIGAACIGAFVWMYFQPPGTPTTPAHRDAGGPGFASGALIGSIAGFVVGWALSAQRHSSRKSP